MLQEGKLCSFLWVSNSKRREGVYVEPSEFIIRHGIEISAPPIPHTLSVEVVRPNGRLELDPIFPRGTPSPAEKEVLQLGRQDAATGPAGTSLPIKLWEGEEFQDVGTNELVLMR